MAQNSKIQWTTHTLNPWIGCSKVHEGCKNCYAEADMDRRRGRAKWGPNGTRSVTSESYWKQPLRWDRAAASLASWRQACREATSEYDTVEPYERPRVFCASLADVFEDWQGQIVDHQGNPLWVNEQGKREAQAMPGRSDAIFFEQGYRPLRMDDLRRDLFAMIDATPHLDWLLLTKRPENVRRMWSWGSGTAATLDTAPAKVPTLTGEMVDKAAAFRKNVWLGTSVSNQATYDRQNPELAACRDLCPVTFLSAEPLLGPITLDPNRPVDWVICGGESGPDARTFQVEWARSLRNQCKAAGVPFFLKQLGADVREREPSAWPDGWPHGKRSLDLVGDGFGNHLVHGLKDKKGGDESEWPEDLRVRQFPRPT